MSKQESISVFQRLADKVKESDRIAYKMLFEKLWDPMAKYASAILDDKEAAQDVLQDVWLDYWNRREKIVSKNIKAYLYTALRLSCYKYIRDNTLTSLQSDVIEKLEYEIDDQMIEPNKKLHHQIQKSLSELPPKCREIFLMSRVNEYSNLEIAKSFDITKKTVENQISTALKKLRKDLSQASYLISFLF